jgi:hypothetical protein
MLAWWLVAFVLALAYAAFVFPRGYRNPKARS